jgi:hypothetical protein
VFDTNKHLDPSLMFACKANAYPSGATYLKTQEGNKHSSLFVLSNSDAEIIVKNISIKNLIPVACTIKVLRS